MADAGASRDSSPPVILERDGAVTGVRIPASSSGPQCIREAVDAALDLLGHGRWAPSPVRDGPAARVSSPRGGCPGARRRGCRGCGRCRWWGRRPPAADRRAVPRRCVRGRPGKSDVPGSRPAARRPATVPPGPGTAVRGGRWRCGRRRRGTVRARRRRCRGRRTAAHRRTGRRLVHGGVHKVSESDPAHDVDDRRGQAVRPGSAEASCAGGQPSRPRVVTNRTRAAAVALSRKACAASSRDSVGNMADQARDM